MKPGRNDPCPCGSGKKYKHCCYAKDSVKHEEPVIAAPQDDTAEDTDADGTAEQETAAAPHEKHQHPRDRSRFKGDARGGTSTFNPRTTRGAQRGS